MKTTLVVGSVALALLFGCDKQPADEPLAQEARVTADQVRRTIETAGTAIEQHAHSAAREVEQATDPGDAGARIEAEGAHVVHTIERGAERLVDAGRHAVRHIEREHGR